MILVATSGMGGISNVLNIIASRSSPIICTFP
jgi:hypothetical protein